MVHPFDSFILPNLVGLSKGTSIDRVVAGIDDELGLGNIARMRVELKGSVEYCDARVL
jgi:hypothetical protein